MGAQATSRAEHQDPIVVDARHYSVELENDRVRVLRIKYGPGEKSAMHGHPATVGPSKLPKSQGSPESNSAVHVPWSSANHDHRGHKHDSERLRTLLKVFDQHKRLARPRYGPIDHPALVRRHREVARFPSLSTLVPYGSYGLLGPLVGLDSDTMPASRH